MKTVTVHKAKTHLSQLIAEVEAGEEVVIQRGKDKPAVRLVPVHPRHQRQFGALAGKVSLTPAFFEALPDAELAGWEE